MRDYGKVAPSFWTGETGRQLRGNPEAQLVALYLLTSPHATMIGVYHCPVIYIAHETGLPLEGAWKGLRSLLDLGFCDYDEGLELVWVKEMAKHQVGDDLKPSDNRAAGIAKAVEKLPNSRIKREFLARYAGAYHLRNDNPLPSPSEAPSKPLRSQEQEQEKEIREIVPPVGVTPKRRKAPIYPPEFEAAWKAYPHVQGRSSKPDALAEWLIMPPEERAALPGCIERFRPHVEQICGGKGAPDMARWLKHGKHLSWLEADTALGSDWSDARWTVAVDLWRADGSWEPRLGPRPGEPGCRAPAHVLLTPASAAVA